MATNDFQVFAGGVGANVLSQSDWLALAALGSGFSAGVAQSAACNKAWRQSSTMAAVLAQFIVDITGQNAADDGTTSTLLANLKSAIRAQSLGVVGATRNARMNIAAPSATGTFTADQIVVANSLNGQSYMLSNYSQTLNLGTVGAGGMDIGTAPLNGFVAIYAIYNPTTQAASILATNAATLQGNIYGAGHMPAGYTASALLAVWPIGATAVLQIGVQTDRTLAIAANTALASGATQASFTAISLAVSVPLNAKSAAGYMACSSTSAGGLTMAISPSNALGTATGIGVNLLQAYGNTTSASMYWRAQLPTPQTIYYTGAAGVGTFGANVTVTEYTI